MATYWYVMRCKPNKEDFLARQLEAQGVEVFHPRIRVRTVNPRARKVRPYFPGYIFVHANLDEVGQSTLQWQPGAVGVVAFGGLPAQVPENLIHAIQKRVEEVNAAGIQATSNFEQGDAVIIHGGPFDGYQAIFDARISGNERVRVLLNLLNKQNLPLELSGSSIERKKQS